MFSIKKIFILLFFSFFAFSASAQSTDYCFDYYKFQSVQVSVGAEKENYSAGDIISFVGEIINKNTYPVVDGNVFVRISQTNDDNITDGHYAVDEFIAKEGINIDASSTQRISFTWDVPENLKKGEYRADFFFSVGKEFNLGGLPFTNEIIVGFDVFDIDSDYLSEVYLDRNGTKLNGEKYYQIGSWPILDEGGKVVISQVLRNDTTEDQQVDISYELYYWDSLNPEDLLDSKQETLNVLKSQSKTLTYEIPKIERSVYYLKITAKTQDGAKSILNVRFSSDMEYPRINYFGLTDFPVEKNNTIKIFSCFHNTSNINTEGMVVLSAKDKDGNEIGKIEYSGVIPSNVSAKAGDLKALKDLTYLKLDQTLYDKKGNVIYQKSEIYDCSTLDSTKCKNMMKSNLKIWFSIALIFLLLLSAVSFKRNKRLTFVFIIIAICLVVVWVALGYTKFAAADVTTDGQEKVKTDSPSINYKWVKGLWNGTDSFSNTQRLAAEGQVTVNHSVRLVGDSNVFVGNTIKFIGKSSCSYSRTGGAWDTPYCTTEGVSTSSWYFTDPSGRVGYLRLKPQNSNFSARSSNKKVMSCSAPEVDDSDHTMTRSVITCTAKATGTITVTVGNSNTNIYAGGESYVTLKPYGGKDEDAYWVCGDGTHTDQNCFSSNYWSNDPTIGMELYDEFGHSSVIVDSFYPTWNITVVDVPEVQASCSGTVSGYDITWDSSVTGGNGSYTYSWGGDASGVIGSSGTKTYTTSGKKDAQLTVTSGSESSTVYCDATIAAPLSVSCSNSASNVYVNDSVRRTATASGGSTSYNYSWSGTDGLSGIESIIDKTYSTTGIKSASVSVNDSVTANCADVTVSNRPSISANLSGSVGAIVNSNVITWTGSVSGTVIGTPTYSWSGTPESVVGSTLSVQSTYSSTGTKYATFNVNTSGQQSATANASATVLAIPLTANCIVDKTSVTLGDSVTYTVDPVFGGNGNYEYSWGSNNDDLSGSEKSVTKIYDDMVPPKKSAYVDVISGTEQLSKVTCPDVTVLTPSNCTINVFPVIPGFSTTTAYVNKRTSLSVSDDFKYGNGTWNSFWYIGTNQNPSVGNNNLLDVIFTTIGKKTVLFRAENKVHDVGDAICEKEINVIIGDSGFIEQ